MYITQRRICFWLFLSMFLPRFVLEFLFWGHLKTECAILTIEQFQLVLLGGTKPGFPVVCLRSNKTHLLSATYFYWCEGKTLYYHHSNILEVLLCIKIRTTKILHTIILLQKACFSSALFGNNMDPLLSI